MNEDSQSDPGSSPAAGDGAGLDGGHVAWRPWGPGAFDAARDADRPILLSTVATWSSECRTMDAETYGEPRVAAAIGDGFVPVRADVDRHPRVASRYAMGGVPSTAFLTPGGEVITAAGPLGPDGMRGAIEGVRRTWTEQGSDAGTVPRELEDREPPGGELGSEIESHMLAVLSENHDERAGGWGSGAKFPLPRTVEFALKRDRSMAERALAAIQANLLDDVDGGFHRSAEHADWSGLRTEKLLDANAALVRAFANAYRYTGENAYRDAAERGVEFLTTTLWVDGGTSSDGAGSEGAGSDAASPASPRSDGDGERRDRGAFGASQAGDAEYFGSDATDRSRLEAPAVDRTVIADWNAVAVDALLTYASLTQESSALAFAERALTTLVEDLVEDDRVVHFAAPSAADEEPADPATADPATADSLDARSSSERGLLLDHARTIRALVTAHSVLGADADVGEAPVALARRLAEYALDELRPGRSFVDGPCDGPGLLERPLRPLDANAELADALLDLHAATGEDRYRDVARDALSAFAGAHERFGPQAAHFASVAARLHGGTLRIDVATPAGSDLHRAALRVADHEAVVVPGASARDDAYEPGAAYAVLDGERSAPARSPDELDERVAEVR